MLAASGSYGSVLGRGTSAKLGTISTCASRPVRNGGSGHAEPRRQPASPCQFPSKADEGPKRLATTVLAWARLGGGPEDPTGFTGAGPFTKIKHWLARKPTKDDT